MNRKNSRLLALMALLLLQAIILFYWIHTDYSLRKSGTLYQIPIDLQNVHFNSSTNKLNFKLKPGTIESMDSLSFNYGEKIYLEYTCADGKPCIFNSFSKLPPAGQIYIEGNIESSYPNYKSDTVAHGFISNINYHPNTIKLSPKEAVGFNEKYSPRLMDSTTQAFVTIYLKDGKYAVDNIWINGEQVIKSK